MVSDIKGKNAKPIFMSQAIWDKWLQYWDFPEIKEKSKKASANRNCNPSLHSCGSISTQEHAERLVIIFFFTTTIFIYFDFKECQNKKYFFL